MTHIEAIHILLEAFVAFGAAIAAIQSLLNRHAIREVHLIVNSRLDELISAAKALSRLEGAADQRATDGAIKAKILLATAAETVNKSEDN